MAGMLSSMAASLGGSASGAKRGTSAAADGAGGGGVREALGEDSSDDEEIDGYNGSDGGAAAIRWVGMVGAFLPLHVSRARGRQKKSRKVCWWKR